MLRRLVSSLIASLCLVALLAGCGDDGGSDDLVEPIEVPIGEDPFPIVIEHRFGTTEIVTPPQRVVTAGFNDADYALAFGFTPVAVRDFIGTFEEETRPWAQEALAGADPEKISDAEGILNYEAIAAARPDLILAYSYLEEEEYELLSAIAPTIVEPGEGNLWDDHTRDIGRAFAMSARGDELVAEVEAAFADAQAKHPEIVGVTAAIQFSPGPETLYLLPPEDPRVGLFTSLGLELPEVTGEISQEQIDLLDQDVLIVVGAEESAYEDDPLWQGLDAVKEGRVVYLGGFDSEFAGALGYDSPLSLPYAIDILVPQLAAALAR